MNSICAINSMVESCKAIVTLKDQEETLNKENIFTKDRGSKLKENKKNELNEENKLKASLIELAYTEEYQKSNEQIDTKEVVSSIWNIFDADLRESKVYINDAKKAIDIGVNLAKRIPIYNIMARDFVRDNKTEINNLIAYMKENKVIRQNFSLEQKSCKKFDKRCSNLYKAYFSLLQNDFAGFKLNVRTIGAIMNLSLYKAIDDEICNENNKNEVCSIICHFDFTISLRYAINN